MTATAILIPAPPCIKCGATERDKNGNCRACARATSKAWYEANKEKAKAKMRAWQAANPEKSKASQKAWRDANPDKAKAAAKRNQTTSAYKANKAEYYKANIEKFKDAAGAWRAENQQELRVHQQNDRARKIGAEGQLPRGIVPRLLERQQGMCPCCRQPLGDDFEMDHIIALSNSGPNVESNIQLMRAECNRDKKTKDPLDYMQERGFLL